MRLPAWALTGQAVILDRVPGARDRLGQGADTWQPRSQPVPCAAFPAGEKSLRRAQLVGVEVSKEVYMDATDLSPTAHRLQIGGATYTITDVQEWDGFTVALVVSA